MIDEKGACGLPRGCVRRTIRHSAKKARTIPRRKSFRSNSANRHLVDVRSEEQKVHADQHLLLDAPSGLRRGRQSYAVDQRRRPGSGVVGWMNRKMFEETGDEAEVARLDADRARHQRQRQARRMGRTQSSRSIRPRTSAWRRPSTASPSVPVDGSIWGSMLGFPSAIVRLDPGPNPSETALAEVYEVPLDTGAYGIRGMDIDRNGVVWSSLSSGHLASFDQQYVLARRCTEPRIAGRSWRNGRWPAAPRPRRCDRCPCRGPNAPWQSNGTS